MAHSVFMSIDYDTAYKAVVVSGPGDYERRFETGDPPKDFFDACVHAYERTQKFGVRCLTSSSFEGFCWDVGGYRFDENDMLVKA